MDPAFFQSFLPRQLSEGLNYEGGFTEITEQTIEMLLPNVQGQRDAAFSRRPPHRKVRRAVAMQGLTPPLFSASSTLQPIAL